MSYSTRVYRQRNTHTHDDTKEQSSFFCKVNESTSSQGSKASFFQAKLSIGQPYDKYEKEADAVASKVVNNQHGNSSIVQQKNISSIQRLSTSMEEEKLGTNDARMRKDKEIQEKPEVQMKCASCEKEKEKMGGAVQAKSEGANTASPQLSSKITSSAGQGNALPAKTLSEMNTSFGADFSNVNIHTNTEAGQMNKQLHAQAFTHGNDIYFNNGKYSPETNGGKKLLAHELTHVVQQTGMIQKETETNVFQDIAETAGNIMSNGCRKETPVECPGNSGNFRRLGYIEPMLLVNKGSCTLYVHGIDANGASISNPYVELPSGGQGFFTPSPDAVDTGVVCNSDCNGSGKVAHPYYCA